MMHMKPSSVTSQKNFSTVAPAPLSRKCISDNAKLEMMQKYFIVENDSNEYSVLNSEEYEADLCVQCIQEL
jgi:hypothetical protein